METLIQLLSAIEPHLDRKTDPTYLRVLLTFASFISSLAELSHKQRDEAKAHELHQRSIQVLKEIITLNKDFGPAYAHLAYYFVNHHTETKQLEDACMLLEKAFKSSYHDPDILTHWAKALSELGHHKEAFEKASLALKAHPQNFDAYYIRSQYQHLQKLERQPYYKKRGRRPNPPVSTSTDNTAQTSTPEPQGAPIA
jgi:tetratricopeptide (TPR) repeat protein